MHIQKWDMELYRKYIKRFDIPEDKEDKNIVQRNKNEIVYCSGNVS